MSRTTLLLSFAEIIASSSPLRTHPSPTATNLGSYFLALSKTPNFLASASTLVSMTSPVSLTLPDKSISTSEPFSNYNSSNSSTLIYTPVKMLRLV